MDSNHYLMHIDRYMGHAAAVINWHQAIVSQSRMRLLKWWFEVASLLQSSPSDLRERLCVDCAGLQYVTARDKRIIVILD